ncbi:MAG: ABC transporter ATP-binding protein [Candidatus Micrarchaeota archaeon]
MAAVDVRELAKVIDEKIIVDKVSFSVDEGEIFGLLGSNGSGKTTTFNMLSGLLRPSSGKVMILGKDIKEDKEFKRELGFVTQPDSFYETLTVRENLEFFSSQFGIPKHEMKERVKKLLAQTELTNKSEALASKLSGGMKKRLNMACSLVHDPKVVFLDEPTVGLDPVVRRGIWKLIKELNQEKKTIIITSHYMEEIEYLCNRVAIMFAGRMVASGTPAQLKQRYKLKQMEDVFAHLMKPVV